MVESGRVYIKMGSTRVMDIAIYKDDAIEQIYCQQE